MLELSPKAFVGVRDGTGAPCARLGTARVLLGRELAPGPDGAAATVGGVFREGPDAR